MRIANVSSSSRRRTRHKNRWNNKILKRHLINAVRRRHAILQYNVCVAYSFINAIDSARINKQTFSNPRYSHMSNPISPGIDHSWICQLQRPMSSIYLPVLPPSIFVSITWLIWLMMTNKLGNFA